MSECDDKTVVPFRDAICQKPTMRHQHYLIVVGLSFGASAFLAMLPFVAPQAPLAPYLFANWCLFMLTGLLLGRRGKVADLSWSQSRTWDRLFACALVTFTAAGWFAVSSGNPMFEGGEPVRNVLSDAQPEDVATRSGN